MPGEWRTVRADGVEFEAPAEVVSQSGDAAEVEGPVATFLGPGLRLLIDRTPFADPLTRYASQPDYRHSRETIGGQPSDVVTFRAEDGTNVLAARYPGPPAPLTAVAHVAPDTDPAIGMRMLRSIRPLDEEA
jgi:hypothetical protein